MEMAASPVAAYDWLAAQAATGSVGTGSVETESWRRGTTSASVSSPPAIPATLLRTTPLSGTQMEYFWLRESRETSSAETSSLATPLCKYPWTTLQQVGWILRIWLMTAPIRSEATSASPASMRLAQRPEASLR